jgi:transcriptional regulator with GAF, ATPase, and Fis domain
MDKKHYNQVLDLIGSVFDAYSALLFLPSGSSKYRLCAHFTLSEHLKSNCEIESGQGIVGWIIRNKKPLLIDNLDRQSSAYYLGYYNKRNEEQIKSFMGCPLKLHQGDGALCLDSKQNYTFTRKDQQLLQQFVEHLEKLLNDNHKHSASDQKDHYYSILKLLLNLRWKYPQWSSFLGNFLKILANFSGFKYTIFAARDQNGQNYFLDGCNQALFPESNLHTKLFPMNKGLIGWVFRNNTAITKTDTSPETPGLFVFDEMYPTPKIRSLICCPLVIHFRTRGVLILADEKNKIPSEEFNDFLALITDHLTLFLENLYLKNKFKEVNLKGVSSQNDF